MRVRHGCIVLTFPISPFIDHHFAAISGGGGAGSEWAMTHTQTHVCYASALTNEGRVHAHTRAWGGSGEDGMLRLKKKKREKHTKAAALDVGSY